MIATTESIARVAPIRGLPQRTQRELTHVQGKGTRLALVAITGRRAATVAIALDARQASELDIVSVCFQEILQGGNPLSWSRTGLVHMRRAAEADRQRDEQVSVITQLWDGVASIGAAIGRATERLLTGRL